MFEKLHEQQIKDLIRQQDEQRRRGTDTTSIDGARLVASFLIVAGIFIAIAGLAGATWFDDKYQHEFTSSEVVLQGAGMIVTGLVMLIAFRNKKKQ